MARRKKNGDDAASEPGTAVARLEDLYVNETRAAVAAAPLSGGIPRISTKSEQFSVGDQTLSDPLELIVVADSLLNIYYTEAYDPDEKSPPACFAIGPNVMLDEEGKIIPDTGPDAMHAHESSPDIQGGPNNHDCKTCEMNKFGSAEKGRGKACGNYMQLAVVFPDDQGLTSDQPIKWGILKLSATALGKWGEWVRALGANAKRPPWGTVTIFSFNKKDPDERRRKAVIATGFRLITDAKMAVKILNLRKEIIASKALIQPLPVDEYGDGGSRSNGKGAKPAKGTGKPPKDAKAGRGKRGATEPKAGGAAGRARF